MYGKKIPERAKTALGSWPVVEKSGFIALWYDPDGGSEPAWELPDVPARGTEGCGDWRFRRRRVKTRGQEIEMWESKIYRADPILCDGDGPIAKLRKWYDQFFVTA